MTTSPVPPCLAVVEISHRRGALSGLHEPPRAPATRVTKYHAAASCRHVVGILPVASPSKDRRGVLDEVQVHIIEELGSDAATCRRRTPQHAARRRRANRAEASSVRTATPSTPAASISRDVARSPGTRPITARTAAKIGSMSDAHGVAVQRGLELVGVPARPPDPVDQERRVGQADQPLHVHASSARRIRTYLPPPVADLGPHHRLVEDRGRLIEEGADGGRTAATSRSTGACRPEKVQPGAGLT